MLGIILKIKQIINAPQPKAANSSNMKLFKTNVASNNKTTSHTSHFANLLSLPSALIVNIEINNQVKIKAVKVVAVIKICIFKLVIPNTRRKQKSISELIYPNLAALPFSLISIF